MNRQTASPAAARVPERTIERFLVARVKARGGLCLKWVSPGTCGVPDRIILLPNGRVIFAELKRPVGGRLSARQKHLHDRLLRMGMHCITLSTKEEIDALLREATT